MDRCPFCGFDNRPSDNFCLNCGQRLLPHISSLLNNRYQILEPVGQGGMGKIYKAKDVTLGRYVAVKELKMPGLQSQRELERASRLFEQEAFLLANLHHPSLPHVYDHFSQSEHWYFVMEYIEGQTLTQYLRSMPGKRLPPEEALNIGMKLCTVLGYLHSHIPPIVFSDLKPDNIILPPAGEPYLIDFGIARRLGDPNADNWRFISPGYSPPEQYQSTQINPRADIYSLGATLYQMLSGHPPLKFIPLQLGHQPWIVDLEVLVLSMVQQEEQKRPQDINIVKQAMQHITNQRTQKLNTLRKSVPRDEETPEWKKPNSLQPSVSIDSAAPLTSVKSRDIRLSLDQVGALAWSPDGTHLAAANANGAVHVYTWPLEENLYKIPDETFLYKETLLPIRTWSLGVQERDVWSPPDSVRIAWSPDSMHLAVAVGGTKLFILDTSVENSLSTYDEHEHRVTKIAWSPDGQYIASLDMRPHVHVWEVHTKAVKYKYDGEGLSDIEWSPDSIYLAFVIHLSTLLDSRPRNYSLMTIPGPADSSPPVSSPSASLSLAGVQVFKATSGSKVCEYNEQEHINDIKWSFNGREILSCGNDGTIDIWDARTAQKLRSLEGHTVSVTRIAFLDHNRFLASLSIGGDVYLWDTNTWAQVESYRVADLYGWFGNTAFHPITALIARSGDARIVHLYEFDTTQFSSGSSKVDGIQYTNAKVVLLGDSGVGKSGLGLVLSRQPFEPTESTHGRLVWTFSRQESKLPDGRREIQETLLWDLAGQPGYRLTHQLHLSEVTVALVIFDAHSETDPLAGISHWVRALRTAQRVRGNMAGLKMLLVLARVDRGGKRVSHGRIDAIVQEAGFDAYFETSAKEGTNIAELCSAIEKAIDWEQLPKVSSTELFQRIRMFLIVEKQNERLLTTADDLYITFLRTWSPWGEEKDLSAEFVTGIKLLEATGLIRRLNFGNLVLLQPELLDAYASALVNAVRDEPDGLGNILEEMVRVGNFFIPADERITDREQEKLLLIAMVEDLLSYEIALREQGEEGPYLVFPSESTREHPALPNPENASVVFTFEGPILNIYATLAVRLSHSNLFERKELWKNAVIYEAMVGGTCGIWLKLIEDGKAELTIFFAEHTSPETRFHFEEYVRVHLRRKALAETVQSRRIRRCDKCGCTISDQIVRMREERGLDWCNCPVCYANVDLRDPAEQFRKTSKSQVSAMDRAADVQRARATAQSTVQGKQETNDFDVFLCYNSLDQAAVIGIGELLKEQGLLPWLDVWEMRPGFPAQRQLEQQIGQIKAAAVFVGKEGIGPWQQQEMEAFLRQFVNRTCPVIPVILSDAPTEPALPIFLSGMTWVDFRKPELKPMNQLLFGITGDRKYI